MAAQSPGNLASVERFAGHRRMLGEALDAARRLTDEARPLMQAEVASLEEAASKIGGLCGSHERPSLLIVGQTKAGKSTFINELLGLQAVAQSQSPCTSRVTRLTHSPEPFVRRSPDPDGRQLPSEATEVVGLPCEFLGAGLDLVDTPGLNENPRLDELTMAAVGSHLPIVAYVIDANNGVSRMVEADICSIAARTGGVENIFYLATKMDVDRADADESGRAAEALEREKLDRMLAGLRRLGCLGPEGSPGNGNDHMWRLSCVSCRRVAAVRRRRQGRQQQRQPTEEETRWLDSLQRARLALLAFAGRRLRELTAEAATRLRQLVLADLHAGLAAEAEAVEEGGHRRRLGLMDIRHSAAKLRAESASAWAAVAGDLAGQIGALLRRSQEEVKAEARTAQLHHLELASESSCSESDTVNRCVAEICARAAKPRLDRIQQFVQAPMTHCFLNGVRLMERIRAFGAALVATNEGPYAAALSALRAVILAGYTAPEQLLQLSPQQLQQWSKLRRSRVALLRKPKPLIELVHDPDWKELVAETFIRSLSPKKLVEQIVKDLQLWLDQRHRLVMEAVQGLEEAVKQEVQALDDRRRQILALMPECLKLSFQINTVLTECKFQDYIWDNMSPIATGSQGSRVYRITDAADAAQAVAIKEIILSDGELKNMAECLHYSSTDSDTSDCLVSISGMRLCKLEPDGGWRLQLCMAHLPVSLPVYLRDCAGSPLSDRLGIGLATAEALARLHSQRVVHCNLKLSNVFICGTTAASVKLSDLGQRVSVQCARQTSAKQLFSELASEDVHNLKLILKCLALGTADADAPDAGLAELGEELHDLLRECAHQPEHGEPCCLPAAKLTDRLQALMLDTEAKRKFDHRQ